MKAVRDQFQKELSLLTRGRILFDEPMSRHTSMGVGGMADLLLYPAEAGEVVPIINYLKSKEVPFVPVGNCTNLIVSDSGYRGVLICLADLKGLILDEKPAGMVSLNVEAGVGLSDLIRLSIQESLTGVEFCAGIPGSVGGAVKMNAGAYGSEMREILSKIVIASSEGVADLVENDLRFEYRNLDLPKDAIIINADFILKKGDCKHIRERIASIIEERKKKHPLHYPSAGSIFKNPPGFPAGRIIEELGLKGFGIGGARISEIHGNFIVNTGDAKTSDILALMQLIKERAISEKGIVLNPEVKVIGSDESII
jgi:UDP-N-acetylmuramate dehydrogenase